MSNADDLGKSEQERDDSFAWLENLAAKQGATEGLLTTPEERLQEEPDWVKQAKGTPVESPAPQPAANLEDLGKSEQERDDSFAWLENLAAKQGASEGLLTTPEERREEEPDWVKQAKGLTTETPVQQTPAKAEDLGKSEQERDDSFAWLENLAAKQGASEGLLTKPEERLQEEPEWVKQAKGLTSEPPVSAPAANPEELGKSEQERDDSFAWLENLAAKQGATEGLLTKPEERLEQEPEWVRQAKDLTLQPAPTPEPAAMDDTAAWLRSLDEEEKPTESAPAADETAMWLKSLDEPKPAAIEPAASADVAMPAWMDNIEEETPPSATAPIADVMSEITEEPASVAQSAAAESEVPTWLSELEQEEKVTPASNQDDLPDWLRGDDTMTESAERTQPSDWKPAEEKQPEIIYSPPLEETKEPEIIYSPPLEETRQPEPEMTSQPVAIAPEPETVAEKREQSIEPPREEPKPVRKVPAKEPVAQRSTAAAAGGDQTLGLARNELSRSNIPGALESYSKLIKKARFLDEVIFDLREALYRYPVEVSLWQLLGDAYMRANRLQDALDSYTKAEELLR